MAGRLLAVGRTTIYELIARGDIDTVHIGRSARVPVCSLDAFVAKLQTRAQKGSSSTSATVRLEPPRFGGDRSRPPTPGTTAIPPS